MWLTTKKVRILVWGRRKQSNKEEGKNGGKGNNLVINFFQFFFSGFFKKCENRVNRTEQKMRGVSNGHLAILTSKIQILQNT